MHIVVKIGAHKTVPLSVEARHTIGSVKWQIGFHQDIPASQLRLIFGDDPALKDGLTVEQASVREGAVLHCVQEPPHRRMTIRGTKRRRYVQSLQRRPQESEHADEQDEDEQKREEGEQEKETDD